MFLLMCAKCINLYNLYNLFLFCRVQKSCYNVYQPKIFISQIWRTLFSLYPISFSEFPTKLPQLIVIGKVETLGISGSPTWNCLSWHLRSTPASLMMRISKGKRPSAQQSWRLWIVMSLINHVVSKWNCIQGFWFTSFWKFWEIMNWDIIGFNQGHFFVCPWSIRKTCSLEWTFPYFDFEIDIQIHNHTPFLVLELEFHLTIAKYHKLHAVGHTYSLIEAVL